MDLTLARCFIQVHDPNHALTFYHDTLGLELRNDVAREDFRWITIGAASQPNTSIVLEPPAADPGVTDGERRTIADDGQE